MDNRKPFAGKVVTVTGAAHGIGLATVYYLVSRGATVSMVDIVAKSALEKVEEKVLQEFPDAKISHKTVDVRDRESVEKWIEDTKEIFGRIDGCVNNAGVVGHEYKPISDVSEEDWNYVLDVNLKGVFNCLRAELPVIEDNGSIVNVAGIAGQFGFVNMSPYVASNHGIIGLTKCAAKEIAERGVRVNAICPGDIKTALMHEENRKSHGAFAPKHAPQLFKRYGHTEEVAALIAFLLGDESKFTTSSTYNIDGGWTA
ncbi:hypothetical protein BDV27DRAFT_124700 [Aspergillus caelatus]|uniref:Uncharacterized protein n=1 Tax=Aspergillus caelatus TaxID=61420 RepID=A0A5N7ADZ3_9EURO|nr:uncharacterized protein BDV27DRAFT_124700 [Aspergillus caelatus]KAE8366850.1 hypothetical protein BDV27DRAFT_124700 [Aspergillus caelatus]